MKMILIVSHNIPKYRAASKLFSSLSNQFRSVIVTKSSILQIADYIADATVIIFLGNDWNEFVPIIRERHPQIHCCMYDNNVCSQIYILSGCLGISLEVSKETYQIMHWIDTGQVDFLRLVEFL